MNCELAHERIVLAAYGELPDEQIHELDRHLTSCTDCLTERNQLEALRVLSAAYPVVEPDANLMARSRLRLDEALDALPPKRWYERMGERLVNSLALLQSAPAAAALLLVVGIGAGSLGGFEFAQVKAAHTATQISTAKAAPAAEPVAQLPSAQEPVQVASISGIVTQPNSDRVQVSYSEVVPQHLEGSLNDPAIRQLLMMASEQAESAGIRDNSVGLLAAECRAGHSCNPAGIRDALLVALRYDRNPSVREKALQGLEPYVADDMRVRDAILETVLTDADPRNRAEAISLLEPVEADTSVRQVLTSVSTSDDSPQIRTVSRQMLSREPQFQ